MVGRVSALLGLIQETAPALDQAFTAVEEILGTPAETTALDGLYDRLAPVDFSRQVLATRPGRLAVLPVRGVEWNDLGDPGRVRDTRERASRWTTRLSTHAAAHA